MICNVFCVISWDHSEQNALHSFFCVIWWLVMIFISKPHLWLLIACLLFVCMYVLLSISNTLHQNGHWWGAKRKTVEGEQEKAVFNLFPVLRTLCDVTDSFCSIRVLWHPGSSITCLLMLVKTFLVCIGSFWDHSWEELESAVQILWRDITALEWVKIIM